MKNKLLSMDALQAPVGCAGVDEAGRGPLAGPVVVAAVILAPDRPITGLADSKTLTHKRREALFDHIVSNAAAYAIVEVDETMIDKHNILQATLQGMHQAVMRLPTVPSAVWIDGNQLPDLPGPVKGVVKGDQRVDCISAASILAKVTRDRKMVAYDEQYPEYGFAQHKGYGTAKHRAALNQFGPCAIHRRSFEPVKSLLMDKA